MFCFCHLKWVSLLLAALSLLCEHSAVDASTERSDSALSPIRHLEASLAASSGQGTTVALCSKLPEGHEIAVLVTRSTRQKEILQERPPQAERETKMFGLRLQPTSLVGHPASSSHRCTILGPSAVCSMTGFAADAQHLTRITLRQVESHQALYSHHMPLNRIVRSLAGTMQRVAQLEGSRPFGAQVLVLGFEKDVFQLYTLDPTGGWRHYGGGATAIGRFSNDVKKKLAEFWKKKKQHEASLKELLGMALHALQQATADHGFKSESDQVEGMMLWTNEQGACRMATIHRDQMDEIYRSCSETPL